MSNPPPSLLSRITGLFNAPPSTGPPPPSSYPPQYSPQQQQQQPQYQYPSHGGSVDAGPTLSHEDYFRLRAQQAERDPRYNSDPYDRRGPPPPAPYSSSLSGGGRDYGSVGDGRERARFATASVAGEGGRGRERERSPPRQQQQQSRYDDYSDRRPQQQPPARGRSRSPPRPNFDGPPSRQRSPPARGPPPPSSSSNYDSRSSQPQSQPFRARSPPPRQVSNSSSSSYARRSRSPASRLPPPSSSSLAPRREYSPPGGRSRTSYDSAPPPPPSSSSDPYARGGSGGARDYVDSRGGPPASSSSRYPQDDPYYSSRPHPPPPSSAASYPASRSDYPAPPPPPQDYRGGGPPPSSASRDYDPRYDDRARSGGDRDPYPRSAPMDSYGRPSSASVWQEPAPPLPPSSSRRGEEYPPPSSSSSSSRDAYGSGSGPRREEYSSSSYQQQPSSGRDDRYDSRSYPSQLPPAPTRYDRAPSRDFDRRDQPPPLAPQPNFDLPPASSSRNGPPPSTSASAAPPSRSSREEEFRDRRRPPSQDRSNAAGSYSGRDDRDRREPPRREESSSRMEVDSRRRSESRDRSRPSAAFEADRMGSSRESPRESMGSSSQSSRVPTPSTERPPQASSSRDYLPPPPLPSAPRATIPIPLRRDSGSSQNSSFARPSGTGANSFPSSSSLSNLQSSSSMSGVGSKRGPARDDPPSMASKRPRIDFQPQLTNSKGKKIKPPVVQAPPEALKPKPHRKDSEVCPDVTKEQAPNILLSYIVSLHRPHVRKRHPAASFQYVPLVEKEEGTPLSPDDLLKCEITLPVESPVPEDMKSATGEGTRVEGKQEAALKLVYVLWKCGEIDDDFNPVVDEEELARQTKASACLGITPYRAKVPDLWTKCIECKDLKLYPTLITFPAVPVKPPPVVVVPPPTTDQDQDPALTPMAVEGETPSASASATPTPAPEAAPTSAIDASTPPPTEYTTPRPLLMFTRLPLPVLNPGINLYFHEELSTVTFTNFDALPLPNDEIEAIKAYSLTLIRAVVNRPMVYVDNADGTPGEGPWYLAPVNLEWFDAYQQQQSSSKEKGEKEKGEEGETKTKPKADREMLDWKEMSACVTETFVGWEFNDPEVLEKQAEDAMATGKSEFSRRSEVLRVRRDLNPHSHPDDSPREAGCASLLEFVKSTTTQFMGLTNDGQPLLEIRKIPGVLGHIRKVDKPTEPTANKVHDQKYMIPELSQRSTIAASTFLSSLYIPSITNRLEQVLLVKELNRTLFNQSLEEKRLTQALTAPSTGGEADYERLEYIGDSALKYIATTYLFVVRPGDNEHLLHDARKIIIANGSLTQNCVDSGLPHYIHARDFSVKTWYPHNLSVSRPAIMPTDRELKFQDIGDKASSFPSSFPSHRADLLLPSFRSPFARQTKADVVEAVIGAAFDAGGIESAYRTCKTLTIRVPYINNWSEMAKRVKTPTLMNGFSGQLRSSLPQIQRILKYKFNNEALLCQALTVTGPNHIHFQRLEFFGDSIVDLLSVKYATSKFPSLGPGPLTHMKSAMINNHTTASLCVHLGLQDFAVFDNPLMQRAIAEYVPRIKRAKEKEEELAKSEGRDPGQYWAEIDSPKLLGDIVEAVYAAMLVDSGLQWKSVEDFHNNVQRPWMDKYIRGLGSLAGHPSKMLTEILQARRCMKFEIVKTLTSSLRAPALAKTEVMVHGNCLGWAVEQTPNFSSRRASEFALNAIEAEPGLLDKLCDCVWNGSGKAAKNKD